MVHASIVSSKALATFLLALLLGVGPVRAEGLLWEVRDAQDVLRGHLFGTVHLCSERCFPLPEAVVRAFSASHALALELDPEREGMADSVARAGLLAPGERLDAQLPDQMRGLLAQAVAHTGVDADTVQAMQPWLASAWLMVEAARLAGFTVDWGVDRWLAREARIAGRGLVALETVPRQLRALSAGGQQAQLASLGQTLALIVGDGVGPLLERIRLAWQEGDGESLRAMLDDHADPEALAPLFDDLLEARNREMAQRIGELLHASGPVFVAVGAAHLGGERSIVSALVAMGWRLRRIAVAP